MNATGLRRAFTGFFAERGHTVVPSAGLIPHHPRAPLFTNAGMNQFLPYFLGEAAAPWPRATSVQKCVRIRGKHDDIELIGRTTRHFTFFEMLGNFSFGDYFKAEAIPFAWELLTDHLGLDADRLWITVFDTDDEAADIWRDQVGVPAQRIQRMGDDNFWEMGDTGPCGPCSEIYIDRGAEFGEAGGPAHGSDERYLEIWNLVFMQYDRQSSGALEPLPRRNIDTGAGLERLLTVIEGVHSAWESSAVRPIIAEAEALSGCTYGADAETDVRLRIMADHARSMTFLVSDGVFPSNEDRGYVLRRLIRRAVRQAFQLGVEHMATPRLVGSAIDLMADSYPELSKDRDFITGVVLREEERFRATLRSGMAMLDSELVSSRRVSGDVAFKLHDTHGFPIELTREIASEAGGSVDEAGFESAMAIQRQQSKEAARATGSGSGERTEMYRDLVEQFGTTEFVGYQSYETPVRVLGVLPTGDDLVEIFLDRTPFYAEGGGQVGDSGSITTRSGSAEVIDTTQAIPGLYRHLSRVQGDVVPGQEATAEIDGPRRDAIRRNHTATHMLHWALRKVLGDHVKQAGSLVAPDRLRFDFSHYGPLGRDQLDEVEDLVNDRVLADEPVRIYETSRAEAERLGAIAFFGEKYGDTVRVIEAGPVSTELCGGTHVLRLGMIGPLRILSESSIGANLRRIEATTGLVSLKEMRSAEGLMAKAASLLRTTPETLVEATERKLADLRTLQDELKALKHAGLIREAVDLAGGAVDRGGVLVQRRDGLTGDQLKDLAVATRSHPGMSVVVLGGVVDGKVALVAAVASDAALSASDLLADAARTVGGGGGPKQGSCSGRWSPPGAARRRTRPRSGPSRAGRGLILISSS